MTEHGSPTLNGKFVSSETLVGTYIQILRYSRCLLTDLLPITVPIPERAICFLGWVGGGRGRKPYSITTLVHQQSYSHLSSSLESACTLGQTSPHSPHTKPKRRAFIIERLGGANLGSIQPGLTLSHMEGREDHGPRRQLISAAGQTAKTTRGPCSNHRSTLNLIGAASGPSDPQCRDARSFCSMLRPEADTVNWRLLRYRLISSETGAFEKAGCYHVPIPP